jgi:DNA-damage-inducible protein D
VFYLNLKQKMEKDNAVIPFEGNEIRKIRHNEEWYFSVIDVVAVLTDSPQPSSYWNKIKKIISNESQSLPFWQRLKLKSSDGKNYLTDCVNTEGVLRIVMSVPSPKAEPLKLWLAQVGTERLQETENPELLTERQAELYRAKGYSEEWIQRRITSIETRKDLTNEWKNRGVKEGQEYSILTAEIAKATFGVTPSEHAKIKGLERQNLRDNMTPLELIFTALSEEVTRQISIRDDSQGFTENRESAIKGGTFAGNSRRNLEKSEGIKVVSAENFLGIEGGAKTEELPEG